MHEMGIALEIIDIAEAAIPRDLIGCMVKKVNLQIGKFSAVVPESLRFCFETAIADTALEGAILIIEEIPVQICCMACDACKVIENPIFICEKCGSKDVEIISGRELDVKSIEIADPKGAF